MSKWRGSAREEADFAFLRQAGVIKGELRSDEGGCTVREEPARNLDSTGRSARERADFAFLRQAGVINDTAERADSESRCSVDTTAAPGRENADMTILSQAGLVPSASPLPEAPSINRPPSAGGIIAPPRATPPAPRLSRQQFLVLEVSPGGEPALTALETKMGTPFAADYRGQPYWSGSATPDGGSRRAFSFLQSQLTGIADLLGELGSSELRLSVRAIEFADFTQAEPAAGWSSIDRGPPQLPQSLPAALRAALGR